MSVKSCDKQAGAPSGTGFLPKKRQTIGVTSTHTYTAAWDVAALSAKSSPPQTDKHFQHGRITKILPSFKSPEAIRFGTGV